MQNAVHDLIDAPDIQTAWDIHRTLMAEYGFDRIIYGMTHFKSGSSVGAPEELLILTNHSKDYVDFLLKDGNYLRRPMGRWAMKNVGAKSWSMVHELIAKGTLTDEEKDMLQVNAQMELKAGYTISFSGPSTRYAAAISLVARLDLDQEAVDRIWNDHGQDLELANKVFNLKCTTLPYETIASLTKRQKEVLNWAGDGKSVAEIGIVLGVTPATVEKHLRLARKALNSDTTAQAVLKHAYQNQVFVGI